MKQAEILGEITSDQTRIRAMLDRAESETDIVLPRLVIGPQHQCLKMSQAGFITVSVRHVACPVAGCLHFPTILPAEGGQRVQRATMDRFRDWLIRIWRDEGRMVYVHCFHGVERAPLSVAMATADKVFGGIPFADTYSFIRARRPGAQDRTSWK